MGSISASGIDCAARTAASAISRGGRLLLPTALFVLLSGQVSPGEIDIRVQGLRNLEGEVRLCLTRDPAHFPGCEEDPAAIKRSVPARSAGLIRLQGVSSGVYALSLIHDENNNNRLDTFLAIPREGFGFSRNPRLRMGPPRFDEVRFSVSGGRNPQVVRMTYLL